MRRKASQAGVFYALDRTPSEIRAWQLSRFNELWQEISRSSPYFAVLKREHNIPDSFTDWSEFRRTVPIATRKEMRSCINDMRASSRRADYHRITGGSTAEPIRLPAWRSEDRMTAAESWRGRSWFGVHPQDRLFLLWGHSHLLGRPPGRWIGGGFRAIKDYCLGYRRFSAYDLSDRALRAAGEALLRFRPQYVLGYSVALHRLAQATRHLRGAYHDLGLKVAIATGESFPSPDSSTLISSVFGCPVAMEYGAIETGVIAHQRPDGRFQVFWANCFVEGIESRTWPGCYELLVTTLYPRLIPLVRYHIGDLVCGDPNAETFDQTFDRVMGRCNDSISLGEDAFVHSESFSHVLRDVAEIQAFQVVRKRPDDIVISYVADRLLSSEIEHRLRDRLARIDERLRAARFERVGRLEQSLSGKLKRVVDEAVSSHA